MKCSVCINSYNQRQALDLALASILRQSPPFDWEVIVADDGSDDGTAELQQKYPSVIWVQLPPSGVRGPALCRNAAVRRALGEVLVVQHGDVVHANIDTIERLVVQLEPREFILSPVHNVVPGTNSPVNPFPVVCGPSRQIPIFFLGALWREDWFGVGGCDEEFTMLGSEDNWLADCLIEGRGLTWRLADGVLGLHQSHPRSKSSHNRPEMRALRGKKLAAARAGEIPFCASGGPWRE